MWSSALFLAEPIQIQPPYFTSGLNSLNSIRRMLSTASEPGLRDFEFAQFTDF